MDSLKQVEVLKISEILQKKKKLNKRKSKSKIKKENKNIRKQARKRTKDLPPHKKYLCKKTYSTSKIIEKNSPINKVKTYNLNEISNKIVELSTPLSAFNSSINSLKISSTLLSEPYKWMDTLNNQTILNQKINPLTSSISSVIGAVTINPNLYKELIPSSLSSINSLIKGIQVPVGNTYDYSSVIANSSFHLAPSIRTDISNQISSFNIPDSITSWSKNYKAIQGYISDSPIISSFQQGVRDWYKPFKESDISIRNIHQLYDKNFIVSPNLTINQFEQTNLSFVTDVPNTLFNQKYDGIEHYLSDVKATKNDGAALEAVMKELINSTKTELLEEFRLTKEEIEAQVQKLQNLIAHAEKIIIESQNIGVEKAGTILNFMQNQAFGFILFLVSWQIAHTYDKGTSADILETQEMIQEMDQELKNKIEKENKAYLDSIQKVLIESKNDIKKHIDSSLEKISKKIDKEQEVLTENKNDIKKHIDSSLEKINKK